MANSLMVPWNYGSCIHQNKYPVQDDEYNYHESLQAYLVEGTGHSKVTADLCVVPLIDCYLTTLHKSALQRYVFSIEFLRTSLSLLLRGGRIKGAQSRNIELFWPRAKLPSN